METSDLRPMSLGEVLDRTFTLYRNHFWLFAGIMSLPLLLLLIYQTVLAAFQYAGTTQGRINPGLATGAVVSVLVGAIIGMIVYFVTYGAAQAATIFAVSDLYLGRSASVRASFARVRGKVLRVIGVILLTALIVAAGCLALIIPGLILMCRTGVAVAASMLEDESPSTAISRSMDLTKGFGWQMFLIFVLVWVLSLVVAALFQYPFLLLSMGAIARHQTVPLGYAMLQHLAEFISSVLVGPIGTIAFSLMYYNLRVRKEAFDLQHLMASMAVEPSAVSTAPGAPSAF
jgi:hypothetical protein